MPLQFHKDMDELKTNLIRMASIVDEQVLRAVKSFNSADSSAYKETKAKDEEVDAYDELIQIQCENILALFQPIAYDLRVVISSLMINNQLERCGDISVSISNRARRIFKFNSLAQESGIYEMAERSHKMLSRAIDSLIHMNREMAEQVISSDKSVDELNKSSFDYIIQKMKSNPELIEPLAHMLILARQIERLADHATNIAESLLFVVEAKVFSHRRSLEAHSTQSN
jgi:phosphate transport system protein